jgi:hypothetical protein
LQSIQVSTGQCIAVLSILNCTLSKGLNAHFSKVFSKVGGNGRRDVHGCYPLIRRFQRGEFSNYSPSTHLDDTVAGGVSHHQDNASINQVSRLRVTDGHIRQHSGHTKILQGATQVKIPDSRSMYTYHGVTGSTAVHWQVTQVDDT